MDKCVASSPPNIESANADSANSESTTPADAVSEFAIDQEVLIDLPLALERVVAAGFISQRQAEDILIAPRTKKELNMPPLEIIATREYENRLDPGHPLDVETLTQWLADDVRQPYVAALTLIFNGSMRT